jgi:IS5 family transposase
MHQTRKGKQWYFGMKAHIGVDAHSGLVHTVVATAANIGDVTQTHALLHGEESEVFGDAGYQGVERREENRNTEVEWHVAMKRGERKILPDTEAGEVQELFERVKASIRAKVEHPFHVVKTLFGHRKVRYRGLAKNEAQLYTLFGLGNLLLAKRRLLPLCALNPC